MRSRTPQSESSTPAKDLSNHELLNSFTSDDENGAGSDDGDGSKSRRHIHLELGPLVISGAAIDRVRARFVSL
jgi:hypothetical protein